RRACSISSARPPSPTSAGPSRASASPTVPVTASSSTASATRASWASTTSAASSITSPRRTKTPLRPLEEARDALAFLYLHVLGIDLGELPYPEPPRLLDRLRRALRVRHDSPRTEACYVEWAARFIRFHGLRHPNTLLNECPSVNKPARESARC